MKSIHYTNKHVEKTGNGLTTLVGALVIAAAFGAIFTNGGHDSQHRVKRQEVPPISYGSQVDDYLPELIRTESGGNHAAVSRKGARGLTQVLPSSGKLPGYGVQPLRNHTEAEYIRFTRDYLEALSDKYDGNMVLALAAYNAGSATVDRAIKRAGGDWKLAITYMPQETREYVRKIAGHDSYGAFAMIED
jgi:hypothetical protein